MKRIGILVVSSALLVVATGAASAADDTFADCTSASNYGWNTAWQYVSSSLNRASCDLVIMERAEGALGRALKRSQISAKNSEAHKVCFYEGMYSGYVAALADEYADCDMSLGLLPSVARAAVTVFTAMQGSLDVVDDRDVDAVFDGVFSAPWWSGDACTSYIVDGDAGDFANGVDEFVDSVCWNQ